MLDVALLGTGGMIPLPHRFLTALMVRSQGHGLLVDCGEGTQVAIRAAGLGFKQIDAICLTHFHADHIAGLPGLLLTIGNSGRSQPITILGPQYVRQVVECLCIIAPQLPYPLIFREIGPGFSQQLGPLTIRALPVEHSAPCYAFRFDLRRAPRFLLEKAMALGIPRQLWSRLQEGTAVEVAGRLVQPEEVSGSPRKGLSLCYATDLRPSRQLSAFAQGVDLFVCEGNYGDPEKAEKARLRGHCTFQEAAAMARDAGAKELWLTHYSAAIADPEEYLPLARAIFPNAQVNPRRATLRFQEE